MLFLKNLKTRRKKPTHHSPLTTDARPSKMVSPMLFRLKPLTIVAKASWACKGSCRGGQGGRWGPAQMGNVPVLGWPPGSKFPYVSLYIPFILGQGPRMLGFWGSGGIEGRELEGNLGKLGFPNVNRGV